MNKNSTIAEVVKNEYLFQFMLKYTKKGYIIKVLQNK